MKKLIHLAPVLGLMFAAGTARADEERKQDSALKDARTNVEITSNDRSFGIDERDKRFLWNALQNGMLQLRAAEYALTNTDNARIKDLAERILIEHSAIHEELVLLTQRRGLSMPRSLDVQQREQLAALKEAVGSAFDRAFTQLLEATHHTRIHLFTEAARRANDPAIRALAGRHLPQLEEEERKMAALEAD